MEEQIPNNDTITDDQVIRTEASSEEVISENADLKIELVQASAVTNKKYNKKMPKVAVLTDHTEELLNAAKGVMAFYTARHVKIGNPVFQRLQDVLCKFK